VVGVVGGTAIGFLVDWVLGRALRVRGRGDVVDGGVAPVAPELATVGTADAS
jgi:hypothetical protein